MSKTFEKFSDFYDYQNILKDAANRAGKRLNSFFDSPVAIDYSGIRQGSISELFANPKDVSEEIVGAVFTTEKMKGHLLIAFTPQNAKRIVELCFNDQSKELNDGAVGQFDERAQSAITEVGNLLAGAFFSGLSDSVGTDIDFSAPGYVEDLLGAVLDGLCGQIELETPLLSKAEVKINCRDINLSGTIFIVGV